MDCVGAAAALDQAGISQPHLVGNSIGGWTALELAAIRPAASLTLLRPAGLWQGGSPWYCLVSLRATRWLGQHRPRLLTKLAKLRVGRLLVLGQTHGHPIRTSPEYSAAAIEAIGTCPGFAPTLAATRHRRYQSPAALIGQPPVNVAFGTRDFLLVRRCWRSTAELPIRTTVGRLRGCGHLPMADDPEQVVALIKASAGQRA